MKKTSFVLGYAGTILAFVFSMLMILTVPLAFAKGVMADVSDGELESEHALAINSMAIDLGEYGMSDYSENSLEDFAEASAQRHHGDEEVFADAIAYVREKALDGIVAAIVVAACIVMAIVALIGTLIVKKAPVAGGVLLLLSAFFLLLGAIYTSTLIPMAFASVLLALGGIAIFIPTRANRAASAPQAATSYGRAYAPPQNGYAPPPQYAAPQNGYAPAYAPPQNEYAPPPQYAAPPTAYAPQAAPAQSASPLPFPEEAEKPSGES